MEQSAIYQMHRVRTPTMLEFGVHALAEPDGIEILGVLQRFRVPSELVVYPRTGHGVEEPLLREDSFRRNLAWFDYWVLGQGASPLGESGGQDQR